MITWWITLAGVVLGLAAVPVGISADRSADRRKWTLTWVLIAAAVVLLWIALVRSGALTFELRPLFELER